MSDHDDQATMNGHTNGTAPGQDVAERADELLQRAAALRVRCEELAERLEDIVRSTPAPAPAAPVEPSEGIRIVATNLAMSGASRDEVEARLNESFGPLEDPGLLDEVFAAAAQSPDAPRRRRFARRG